MGRVSSQNTRMSTSRLHGRLCFSALDSTLSLRSSTDYNSNSLKEALGFILPVEGLIFVTPDGEPPFSAVVEMKRSVPASQHDDSPLLKDGFLLSLLLSGLR